MTKNSQFVIGVLSLTLGLSQTPGATEQRCASPSAATIQNTSFDAATGTLTFDLVNNAASALTAYTYEISYTNADGDPISGHQYSEDRAGLAPMLAALPGDLSTGITEDMLPIPPAGRHTFQEDLGAGSTGPTVVVIAALFADGTSLGRAEAVRQFKRQRVEAVEQLGLYLAVLHVADKAAERADVFAALDAEADARPAAVRDMIRGYRAELQHMPGDVHKNLRDMITIINAQRAGVARGH
jgi:hypothetical protein